VFQTTHTGGHRFAPNVVVLPDGIVYGRITADEGPAVIDAHRKDELHDLSRMRGRTEHDPPAQAAEVFLRRELGLRGLDDLRLAGTSPLDGGRSEVRFVDPTGAERRVVVVAEERPALRPTSCGDAPKPITCFRRAR
jgi:(2Fe-2S) ferredoxin